MLFVSVKWLRSQASHVNLPWNNSKYWASSLNLDSMWSSSATVSNKLPILILNWQIYIISYSKLKFRNRETTIWFKLFLIIFYWNTFYFNFSFVTWLEEEENYVDKRFLLSKYHSIIPESLNLHINYIFFPDENINTF